MVDVVELTKALIACPSVTPKDEGAQALLAQELEKLGFTCYHLPFGEGEERIENLFARLGSEGPHMCYAGHTDVVPAGAEDQWTYGPFIPTISADGKLYGRGASDMKGSVAAFTTAVAAYLKNNTPKGSISLLITGDEESDAINGTIKVLGWMKDNGHTPDVALVGEPTNPDHLGQEIKIGRRGSITGMLSVTGKQGHVAYQHLADNPMPRLIKLLDVLASHEFDQGTEFFGPTNCEITTIDVGNTASNVIPQSGSATFNIRFNDLWSSEKIQTQITSLFDPVTTDYEITFEEGAESFITQPGAWSEIVRDAVNAVTGKTPAYTTTGGTSDARFMVQHCPTIECGAVNKTIHQIDEYTDVEDLKETVRIYEEILKRYFA